jgi:hypothetical protein
VNPNAETRTSHLRIGDGKGIGRKAVGMAKKPKKPRYDLREYWPWHQRNWPTSDCGSGLPSATPPPFGLGEVSRERFSLPPRQRLVAQILSVVLAVAAVVFVVWGVFH